MISWRKKPVSSKLFEKLAKPTLLSWYCSSKEAHTLPSMIPQGFCPWCPSGKFRCRIARHQRFYRLKMKEDLSNDGLMESICFVVWVCFELRAAKYCDLCAAWSGEIISRSKCYLSFQTNPSTHIMSYQLSISQSELINRRKVMEGIIRVCEIRNSDWTWRPKQPPPFLRPLYVTTYEAEEEPAFDFEK